MKYAKEVIDLMAAYPGRTFRMRHILHHVATRATAAELAKVCVGVWRVLGALQESGQIKSDRAEAGNGHYAQYSGKTITSGGGEPLHKPAQYVRTIAS